MRFTINMQGNKLFCDCFQFDTHVQEEIRVEFSFFKFYTLTDWYM